MVGIESEKDKRRQQIKVEVAEEVRKFIRPSKQKCEHPNHEVKVKMWFIYDTIDLAISKTAKAILYDPRISLSMHADTWNKLKKEWGIKKRKITIEECPKGNMKNPTEKDLEECGIICQNPWGCHTFRHLRGGRTKEKMAQGIVVKLMP